MAGGDVNDVIVPFDADINWFAANSISIDPDFVTESGATFTAEILECIVSTKTDDGEEEAMSFSNDLAAVPNPFDQSTTLRYQLMEDSHVELSLFDISGKKLKRYLNDEWQQAGNYQVQITPRNLKAGIYICILETNTERKVVKLIKSE